MVTIVGGQDMRHFQGSLALRKEAGQSARVPGQLGKGVLVSHPAHLARQGHDELLLGCQAGSDGLCTYNSQAKLTVSSKQRIKRNAVAVLDTSSCNFHQTQRATFARLHLAAQQDSRASRILVQALVQSERMTQSQADKTNILAYFFTENVARDYQFVDETPLHAFMQRRLDMEAEDTADFLHNQHQLSRWMTAHPNMTDSEALNYTTALINGTIERETLPLNISVPFVRYLTDSLLQDLSWIDWGKANKRITTAMQAIHALHVHTFTGTQKKLDGLALGERLAAGDSMQSVITGLGPQERIELDKAALLFSLASGSGFKLDAASQQTQLLGDQLVTCRKTFLAQLREEWQLSRMFMPNADYSNVYLDHNALVNAQGKTFSDLVSDSTIISIPGVSRLNPQEREALVRRKLNRMGESTEYRFGSLQHGMATVLTRSMLLQGKTAPTSFGTEAPMVEQFLQLCRTWEAKQSVMLNPKVLLGQYLAQASGENVTAGATTPQQKIAALETYLQQRWLANYAELPKRFDRRAAALNILKTAMGNTKTEQQLTQVKQQFTRVLISANGMLRMFYVTCTPLDNFLYLANHPVWPRYSTFQFAGHTFNPKVQLQAAEEAYNQALPNNAWIQARAKENIRETGRELNAGTLQTELEAIIAHFHATTEAERANNDLLSTIRGVLMFENIWRFCEGIYNGNTEEIIGAIPIVSNIYELEEGIRHHDAERAVSAIPVIGSGHQLERALRKGDGIDIIMTGTYFIFDLATVLEMPSASAAEFGLSAAKHAVLKEAELPTTHAIGLRNYLSMSKILAIPLKGVEHLKAPIENFERPGPALSLGDPYGIESHVTHPELPTTVTGPIPSTMGFGAEMNKYQVTGPRSGITPDAAGIYTEGNKQYIKSGEQYYPVRYDADNSSWRVFYRDNPAKPAIPVRHQDGEWQIHSDVGLRGGAPASPAMGSLFNSEMENVDVFFGNRKRTVENSYEHLKYGHKPYESGFDVQGGFGIHTKPLENYPKTGQAYFDITTHGSWNQVLSISRQFVSPRTFAKELKSYVKFYTPGNPIRLLACETARGGKFSFAQRFANAMNAPVKAYTADIRLLSSPANLERYAKVFEPFASEALRRAWS